MNSHIKEPRGPTKLVVNIIALVGSIVLMGGPLLVYAFFFGVF